MAMEDSQSDERVEQALDSARIAVAMPSQIGRNLRSLLNPGKDSERVCRDQRRRLLVSVQDRGEPRERRILGGGDGTRRTFARALHAGTVGAKRTPLRRGRRRTAGGVGTRRARVARVPIAIAIVTLGTIVSGAGVGTRARAIVARARTRARTMTDGPLGIARMASRVTAVTRGSPVSRRSPRSGVSAVTRAPGITRRAWAGIARAIARSAVRRGAGCATAHRAILPLARPVLLVLAHGLELLGRNARAVLRMLLHHRSIAVGPALGARGTS